MTAWIAYALLAAAQTAAPPPAPGASPTPPGARIQAAAQAFSACIGPKVAAIDAALTPEQGADSVLAACKAEQTALEGAVEAMIGGLPAEQQTMARGQLTAGMAQARTQIADGIRQSRGAAAAAPAAAPTPAPKAAPAPK